MSASIAPTETCNRLPSWLERVRRRFPRLCAAYATFDARTLGLARIYLALLLLTDLFRRVRYLRTWYINDGLLPNHLLLWRPRGEYPFSFFFLASQTHEAVLLFVLCGVVFLCLLVGYRTRLFQVLSFVCICSLHNRLIFFDDGSETTTRLFAFWTMFLPLGARFSVDALRAGQEHDREERPNTVVSLAVTAILVQLALIYVFNALHKSGPTWRVGSAVHYVLHQDRIVTWLGWMLRPHLTLGGSRVLSWASIATESLLPILILSPVAQRYTRRAAIALATGLHIGFALLLTLWLLAANMIGFFLLLISAEDWDLLARWLAAHPGWQRRCAAIASSLRTRTERVLRAWQSPRPSPAPLAPWPRKIAERAPFVREASVVVCVLVLGAEMSNANRVLPAWMHVRRPEVFRMLVAYPRLYQGWSMFAPDAPETDIHVFVDAITVDGRHVDPLNELGSRVATTPLLEIPERLAHDDSFCDYVGGIVNAPEYHGALQDWLFAYDQRSGRASDRIVSFKVWVLEDTSPKPGSSRPSHARQRLLFKAHR